MNRKLFSMFIWSCLSALALLGSGPLWAQTGDDIVPAIESICDDDPFSFGLCNAYCEALDCDSETPIGSPRACERVLDNYMNKSGGLLPPCENQCPCAFNPQADFPDLVADANADFDPDLDPSTLNKYCEDYLGGDWYIQEEYQPDTEDSPFGVQLWYYIEPAFDTTPAMCVEWGGEVDGPNDTPEMTLFHMEGLSAEAEADCADRLAELCASLLQNAPHR